MANVMLNLTNAAADTLGVVSVAATTITRSVSILGHIADVGESLSRQWKEETVLSQELARKQMTINATTKAKLKVAEKQLDLVKRLEDPALKAIYDQVDLNWDNI